VGFAFPAFLPIDLWMNIALAIFASATASAIAWLVTRGHKK
jgi:hypothetical protein